MSFILDALHKSEQARQANALQASQQTTATVITPTPQPARRIRIQLLPAGLLLLGIGLLLIWWLAWSPSQTMPPSPHWAQVQAPQVLAAIPAPASAPATTVTPNPATQPAKPTPRNERTMPVPQTTFTPSAPSTSATPPTHPVARPPTPRNTSPTTPTPQASLPAPASEAIETAPMPMDELPVHLLAELPKITIAAHSYSKQAKTSFIFANDRMLHEAENLSPGLRLEHITPDSMIFSYKGYRFRRGLQP